MKNVRNFESFRTNRKGSVNESSMVVGDHLRVNAIVDIKLSDINTYVKKVKESIGKNVRDVYSDSQIAEEIVKYLTTNIDFNTLSTGFLFGMEDSPSVNVETETEPAETDVVEEAPVEEVQPETPSQEGEFKEVEDNLSTEEGGESEENEDLPI